MKSSPQRYHHVRIHCRHFKQLFKIISKYERTCTHESRGAGFLVLPNEGNEFPKILSRSPDLDASTDRLRLAPFPGLASSNDPFFAGLPGWLETGVRTSFEWRWLLSFESADAVERPKRRRRLLRLSNACADSV